MTTRSMSSIAKPRSIPELRHHFRAIRDPPSTKKPKKSTKSIHDSIASIQRSMASFKKLFMNGAGFVAILLESGTENGRDTFVRYLRCLDHQHPVRNDSDASKTQHVPDSQPSTTSNPHIQHEFYTYIPNYIRLRPDLLPRDLSIDAIMRYFTQKDSWTKSSFQDFYMLMVLYLHFLFMGPEAGGGSFSPISATESPTRSKSQTKGAPQSYALSMHIKMVRFLLDLVRVRGGVILFNNKTLEFWVNQFMQRKIRFLRQSAIENELNALIEAVRLQNITLTMTTVNTLESMGMPANAPQILKKLAPQEELQQQIIQCFRELVQRGDQPQTYDSWQPAVLKFLSSPQLNLSPIFDLMDSNLVQEVLDRVIWELESIEKKHSNSALLTTEDINFIVICMRILNAYYNINFVSGIISGTNGEPHAHPSPEVRFHNKPLAKKAAQATLQILSKYGRRVIIIAKCFKLLGNISHFVPDDTRHIIEIMFSDYAQVNWKNILKYAEKNSRGFPYKSFLEYLKGIERVCHPFLANSQEQKEFVKERYFTLISALFKTSTRTDPTDRNTSQQPESNPSLRGSETPPMDKTHLNQSPSLPQGTLTDEMRERVDFQLLHGKSIFIFLNYCIRNHSKYCPEIRDWIQTIITETQVPQPQEDVIQLIAAVGVLLNDQQLSTSQPLISKVVLPRVHLLLQQRLTRTSQICTLVALAQLPQIQGLLNVSPQDKQHIVLDFLWSFMMEDVIFNKALLPELRKGSSHSKTAYELFERHKASHLYSFRFIITNALSRFTESDKNLLSKLLHNILRFSQHLESEWHMYQKEHENTSASTVKFVGTPQILRYLQEVAQTTIVLLSSLSHTNDEKDSIEILHILSRLNAFKLARDPFSTAVKKCLRTILNSSNKSLGDELLPDFIKSPKVGPDALLQPRARFYLDVASLLLPIMSSHAISHQIIPYAFLCLLSKDEPLLNAANNVLVSLFRSKIAHRNTIIPQYVDMTLGFPSKKLKVFLGNYSVILRNIPSKHATRLELALLDHCMERILERLKKVVGKPRIKKDVARSLTKILIELTETMHVDQLPLVMASLEAAIHILPDNIKARVIKDLYKATVECVDYTRKEACTDFYIHLCVNHPTISYPLET